MAERMGSPVLNMLWLYVLVFTNLSIIYAVHLGQKQVQGLYAQGQGMHALVF